MAKRQSPLVLTLTAAYLKVRTELSPVLAEMQKEKYIGGSSSRIAPLQNKADWLGMKLADIREKLVAAKAEEE